MFEQEFFMNVNQNKMCFNWYVLEKKETKRNQHENKQT